MLSQKNKTYNALLFRAALVGLAAGGLGVLFRYVLESFSHLTQSVATSNLLPPHLSWMPPIAFCALCAVFAAWLTSALAPEAKGSGIPHVKAVLKGLAVMRVWRLLPVKFLGGAVAIGGGLALGREGPTVQMGAAVGTTVSTIFKTGATQRRTLTIAGAGAGLAAAFNAPLSGVVFALEEMQRDFRTIVFGAVFIASVMADIVCRLAYGQAPVLAMPLYQSPALAALPFFLMMGGGVGLLGVAFNKLLLRTVQLTETRFGMGRTLLYAAAVGATVGMLFNWYPEMTGDGHALALHATVGGIGLPLLALLLAGRFLLTIASYGAKTPGGIFTPLLAFGCIAGAIAGGTFSHLAPTLAPSPGAFAVAGMAACFAAIVRSPLTGIALVVEMTGDYALTPYLLASAFAAYLVAEYCGEPPIYDSLMRQSQHMRREKQG